MSIVQTLASVSVIIPCYCCTKTIGRTVESVLSQTLLPKELFLIDDASLDDNATVEVLQKLKQEYGHIMEINIISLDENKGPGVARNIGWDVSNGEYIAFLDADDSWHPEKLRLQYQWMRNNSSVALSGHICNVSEGGHANEKLSKNWNVSFIKKMSLMLRNPFSAPSVMVKRDIPFRFEDGQFYAEDYYLWQQIICAGYVVARIELPLASLYKARYGASGLSSHLWSMQKGDISNYWKLYRQKYLNFWLASLLTAYSLLKYCRRVLLVIVHRNSCM